MQTFVPHITFPDCARVLDRQRLGKQRVECLQILKALSGSSKGWVNHPATKMWRGYEPALCWYAFAVCNEWCKRGYADTCREKITQMAINLFKFDPHGIDNIDFRMPHWWTGPIHATHRAVLLHKDHDWYGQFNWLETPSEEYHWPT